jgi:SulP family sulfate permease
MGGDSTVGLSKMNVLSCGTSRISATVASLGILACIMGAYPLLNFIPIVALTGIMFVLALHTFAWPSIPYVIAALLPNERWRSRVRLFGRPLLPANVDRYDALIMLAVTVISAISNIVYATGAGLVLASLRHTWASAHDFSLSSELLADGVKLYKAHGELFFGSTTYLHLEFDYVGDPDRVRLLLEFEPRDYSAIHALRKVAANSAKCGKSLEVRVHGAKIRDGDAMDQPLGPSDGLGDEWQRASPLSAA